MKLKIWNKFFQVKWNDSVLSKAISDHFPVEMKLDGRYGDELYTLTDFWFELDNSTKEVFEIWDIVYWVKLDNSKEAIAIFFWNTPAWDWREPRPVSKCSLIWKIIWKCSIWDEAGKWEKVLFELW